MKTSVIKAIQLILSMDRELLDILSVTAEMSIQSSIFALIIGLPIGMLLGAYRFPGRNGLLVANRTLMGMPPVVCGLLFYMLFSGVGPFRHMKLLFTVDIMIMAQIVLITPIVVGNMESYVAAVAPSVRETAKGLGLGGIRTFFLLCNECVYQIISAYLMAFARSIAEVGAVSMVGGAIAWKTNVMTTAIMQHTNRGNFTLGVALGIILLSLSLLVTNRTMMGMPPVVCGLVFYMLFSGVGPFRHMKLLFTVDIMIMAQIVLITPIVVGNVESYVSSVAPSVRETAKGLGLGPVKTFFLLCNECVYQIISAYLMAFARSIAEVGAVSMVGGAIAWKTNVMTTAIMQHTNRGNFTLGVALGIILLSISLLVNIVIYLLQRRLSR